MLSGNGRGIGAYKILRGMYKKTVHAVYLSKNEEATRRFVRRSDIEKVKLATRLKEFGIDLLSAFDETDRAELAARAAEAKNDKPLLNLSDMAEQAGQGPAGQDVRPIATLSRPSTRTRILLGLTADYSPNSGRSFSVITNRTTVPAIAPGSPIRPQYC